MSTDCGNADGVYAWWMRRFERAFSLYDVVRLDHFRGFEAYWAIPKGEKASKGHWMPGPGLKLFRQAYKCFGSLPIIAEDLGYLTPGVRMLLAGTGFPGMDVMQFSDTDPRGGYNPQCDRVSYTGTHDNETLLGWCRNRYRHEIEAVLQQQGITDNGGCPAQSVGAPEGNDAAGAAAAGLDTAVSGAPKTASAYEEAFDGEAGKLADSLMQRFLDTDAFIKIVPLQDILGLGNEARMNVPGTVGTNWKWQAKEKEI